MKAVAQRTPANTRAARRVVRPSRMVPRPAASGLSRERQAHEVARRFVGGKTGLARELTPAPAAALRVPSSRAEPVANPLRNALEHGFDADLHALRIHRDPAAAAATARLGARAFASGSHVYFAPGAFEPATSQGRELIAHEVAHTLQQAGSASSAGIALADRAPGTGAPQCAEDFAKSMKKLVELDIEGWREITFDDIVDAHMAEAKSPDEYGKLYEAVATDLGLGAPEVWADADWSAIDPDRIKTFVANLAGYPKAFPGEFAKGALAGFGLLSDCLKKLGRFEAAFGLLADHPRLTTVASHAGVFAQLDSDRGMALFENDFEVQQIVKPFVRDLPIRVTAMLLAPSRGFYAHTLKFDGATRTLKEAYDIVLERALEHAATGENELLLSAYLSIFEIERSLMDAIIHVPTMAEATLGTRRLFAADIERYGSSLQSATATDFGRISATVKVAAGREIELAARRVVQLWDASMSEAATDATVKDALRADPVAAKVTMDVERRAKTLLAVARDGSLPPAREYGNRVKTFQDGLLRAARDSVEPALLKLARKNAADLATPTAIGYAWLMRWLYEMSAYAGIYAIEEDRRFVQRWERDDVRGAHRVVVARQLLALAEYLDHGNLRTLSRNVMSGRDRPALGNQVFLLTDWEPDAEADYTRLRDELPSQIRGMTGPSVFSGTSLALLFSLVLLSRRVDVLTKLLAENTPAGDQPLHRKVNRMLGDLELPKRWFVRNAIFAAKPPVLTEAAAKRIGVAPGTRLEELKPEQVEKVSLTETRFPEGEQPGQLVLEHPKTEAQLISIVPVDEGWDLLVPNDRTDAVFAWVIPPVQGLYDILREVESLNFAVRRVEELSTGKAPDEGWVATLTDGDWTDYLLRALTEPLVDVDGTKVTVIDELLASLAIMVETEARYEATEKRYVELLKQAAARQRASLVAEQKAILEAKDESLEARLTFARNTLVALQQYANDAFPYVRLKKHPTLEGTLRIQLAIATLALAESLDKRIGKDIDDRLIVGLLRLTDEALAFVANRVDWVKAAGAEKLGDLLAPGETSGPFLAGEDAVRALQARLTAARHRVQLMRGFRGERKTGEAFSGLNAVKDFFAAITPGTGYSTDDLSEAIKSGKDKDSEFVTGVGTNWEISPGDEFTIDGEEYMLLEVGRPFVYFPSYAGPLSTEFRKGRDPAFAPPIVLAGFPSSVAPDIDEKLPRITDRDRFLVAVLHDDRVRTVHAPRIPTRDDPYNDEELAEVAFLDKFAHAVTMQSRVIGLEQTGELVEFFGELMMEVVATIFGLQAAKTAIDFTMVAASDEITQLVEQLQNDPVKFVRDVVTHLEEDLLVPETFLKVMLFPAAGAADTMFSALERISAPKTTEPRPGKGAKPKTPIGRVIRALVELGKHVAGSLVRLHKRLQGPVGAMRARVAMHPALAHALSLIVIYGPIVIEVAGALKDEYDKIKEAGEKAEFEDVTSLALAGLKTGGDTLSEEIDAILTTLATLEIPKKIVPLIDLVSAIGDLVLKVLARSGKAKIANKIAGALGVKQKAYEQAAKAIEGTVFDPNWHWETNAIPLFAGKFKEVQTSFVTALETNLTKAADAFNKALPASLKASGVAITIKSSGEVAPEAFDGNYAEFVAAPFREGDAEAQRLPPLSPEDHGEPLPDRMRTDAENRFKHNFRHVRLHTGPYARRTTSPAHALALTSGSHVWIDPAVSLASERGRRVLDHELAHVLQQAGPRPLGKVHSPQPQFKRGACGVVIDPTNEREAERIAERVLIGVDEPIDVPERDVEGFAPAGLEIGTGLVLEFVDLVSSYRDTAKLQKSIDEQIARGKVPKDVPGLKTALGLWTQIQAALAAEASYRTPATFKEVRAEIAAHVRGHDVAIRKAIPIIAQDTQTVDTKAMAEKVKKQKAAGRKKAIAQQIYMLDPRPFVNQLGGYLFTKTGVAIDVDLDIADKTKPKLKTARVHYLNLGRVPPGHALWTKLHNKLDIADQREMQVRLAVLDPVPGLWDRDTYTLSSDYMKRYLRWQARREKYGRPPTTQQYLEGIAANTLSIATHGTLTTRTDNDTERESHHTTQFLLIQYFSNAHTKKTPFFPGLPGVDMKKKRAHSFSAPGRRTIDIASLFEGDRGGPMPAILLSRETHRQGKLHIDRGPQWTPEGKQTDKNTSGSQALMIDWQYKSRLASAGLAAAADAKSFSKQRATLGDDKTIQLGIYNAMTGTYAWMHKVMTEALRYALPRNEYAFYASWVARHGDLVKDGKVHKDYQLDTGRLDHDVYKRAVEKDEEIMGKHGWIK